MSLSGKTAVITGSNSGIGLGVAIELAKAGADIVLNSFTDRPEDHALADRIAIMRDGVFVQIGVANARCDQRDAHFASTRCLLLQLDQHGRGAALAR